MTKIEVTDSEGNRHKNKIDANKNLMLLLKKNKLNKKIKHIWETYNMIKIKERNYHYV